MSEVRNIEEGKRIKARGKREIDTDIDFDLRSPKLIRILLVLLAVVIVVFCVYQVARSRARQKSLHTQTALSRTITRTISADAYVLRAESVIPGSGGTVVPEVDNGSKVAIGDTVAKAYPSEDAALNSMAYSALERELAYYQDISTFTGNMVSVGMEHYNQNILARLLEYEKVLEGGDLSVLSDASKALASEVTKRQIAIGRSVDVEPEISVLYEKLNALEPYLSRCTEIKATRSGFYVNETDGYEGVGEYGSVQDITPAGVEQLLNAKPATGGENVGKLITEFNWYLVCNLSAEEATELSVGGNVSVSFSDDAGDTATMKVKAINNGENGVAAVVLVCDRMDARIAKLRVEKIKIRTKEYTGFAVQKSAVRTVDGDVGVFIQLGNIVRFRKIKIIFSDESIVLAANTEESGYLRLYDEIIVEGTDLYDGKIIN